MLRNGAASAATWKRKAHGDLFIFFKKRSSMRTTRAPRVLSTDDDITEVRPVYAADWRTKAAALSITTAFSGSERSEKNRVL